MTASTRTRPGPATCGFVPEFEAALRRQDNEQPRPATHDRFEYRLDRSFRQAAWEWAWTQPARVLHLAGIKFLRVWNVWPNEPVFAAWPVRLVVLVTYVPLIAFAILGAWRFRALGWPVVLCWLPAVYFTLLHTVFVSSIRYRQPALLGLMVLAAGYLAGRVRQAHFASTAHKAQSVGLRSPASLPKAHKICTRLACPTLRRKPRSQEAPRRDRAADQLLLVLVQVGPDRSA